MTIDLITTRLSPQGRAVQLTAKALKIDLNVKNVDFTDSQALESVNPAKSIPSISDGGFVLWEGKAIQQYLVNQYAPDSPLYPKDPKERAVVDRWLNFDNTVLNLIRDTLFVKVISGADPPEQKAAQLKEQITLFDKLVGENKYLNGKHLTIADLAVLATAVLPRLLKSETGVQPNYPNLKRYYSTLIAELPYFDEVNKIEQDELQATIEKLKARYAAKK